MEHYTDVAVTVELSDNKLDEIKTKFERVHYYPDGTFPEELLDQVDMWYTGWNGLPDVVKDVVQIPRTKVVQLSSAGAYNFLARDTMASDKAKGQIKVCSASGIHILSIPPYVVANIVNLYMKMQIQLHIARSEARWPSRKEINDTAGHFDAKNTGNRNLRGSTVGFLGYGHIGRETARLVQAYHCHVIAANTRGNKAADDGYIISGTGDPDGSIPSAYYATSDPSSFRDFLSRCDVLVASLPSTPQTRYMLTAEHLAALPNGAIFINVGRGDLVRSEDILAALDSPSGLTAVALDVTDPEPLPAGHPLFTHPRVIITPHTSGGWEGYFDDGADVLLYQAERIRAGREPVNVVDPAKGY